MKGSVLIIVIVIMAAISFLLITAFSIMESHYIITRNEELHQQAFYLAEAGINFALNELQQIVMKAHEECLDEFIWDPYRNPGSSLQESARQHVAGKLGPVINKKLTDKGYLINFPDPDLTIEQPDTKVDVRIRFTDIYKNPSRLLISSRCEIGNIRRRIDSEVLINKISGVCSSKLFEFALISGGGIKVSNEGNLQVFGSVFAKGGIQAEESSSVEINRRTVAGEDINISNNSRAVFSDNIISRELVVSGHPTSYAACLGDVYAFNGISASGQGNSLHINGKLYICPDDSGQSAGVSAIGGASIILENEVFINGTLNYDASGGFLFGLEEVPIVGETFRSCESIGGWNHSFYFPNYTPEYARHFFKPGFTSLDTDQQADLVYNYINNPPELEIYGIQYYQHLSEIHNGNILFGYDNSFKGHASGLVFADNQVIKPVPMSNREEFYNEILYEMKSNTDWNINSHINFAVPVIENNIAADGNSFTVLDPARPIVYIIPDEKDIILPPGEYRGILVTNGSVLVQSGDSVIYKGLIISGENLTVNGDLTVYEDISLVFGVLGSQGNNLSRFFCIESEKPLFEIKSCKEVLYNSQW